MEIRYNTDIGTDIPFSDLLNGEYKAVFVGVGARLGTGMRTPGEDEAKEGFMNGADFLRDVALGKEVFVGNTIMVVGGGNVAIDCVRTALRLGYKDVKLVYRRTEAEMPADKVEIDDAHAENIEFLVLHNPTRLILDENEQGHRGGVAEDGAGRARRLGPAAPGAGEGQRVRRRDRHGGPGHRPGDRHLAFLPEDGVVKYNKWNEVQVEGLNKLCGGATTASACSPPATA